ncbi:uracil-DNA glycosylase [Gemelliphila asaccharolytica]|uniref:Uracil-DNA glycosylase n=1 Tax=Gemelliphila asaccharolytica TaxID=502393 RepID=A0ABR5TKB1_9BACL|nr:uracil-DNA glycosylase [Gemella asaccharolytica]
MNIINKSWEEIFKNYSEYDELIKLNNDIEKQRETKIIFPKKNEVYKVFSLPIDKIKVVILGQDPYHKKGQAMGLSFSVNENIPLPKSLINIYKELYSDVGIKRENGSLIDWFKQGVFLLNTVLTVEQAQPASHRNLGYENFTDYIISEISKRCENIVFILWGGYAKKKIPLINQKKHLIIQSAHPSPLSAYRGFFGSKPFSKTNEYLKRVGKKEIIW